MSRLTKVRLTPSMGVALAALVLAASGVAIASIPGPDNVIFGCYETSAGALRVIDSGKTCNQGETALNWSQAGPAGPAGPPGANGAAGAPGRDGAGASTRAILIGRGSEVPLTLPGKNNADTDLRHMTLDPGNYVVTGHVTLIGQPEFTRARDHGVDRGTRVLLPDVDCELRLTPPVDGGDGPALDQDIVHLGASSGVRPQGRQDDGQPIRVDGTVIGAVTSVNFRTRLTLQGAARVATRSRVVVACHQASTSPNRRLARGWARMIAVQVGSIEDAVG
jgi:hypothetical protein